MSKDKKLRKILIDKLYHKNQNLLKQSTRSNAPTESTPNQPKNFSKVIQNFFENFQTECAIIYEPVKLKNQRHLKRSLEQQLSFIYKNEEKLILKTQENQILNYSNFYKNSSSIMWNRLQHPSNSRIHSQNSNCQSRSKQTKIINTDARKQNILKSKSMIFNTGSVPQNSSLQKYRTNQYQVSKSKQFLQPMKFDRIKSTYQPNNQVKSKQQNQYMTNSKYIASKYVPKNAPIKPVQKIQRIDRIKRVQSLKNLNQNGVRKYFYKRQL